MMLFEMVVELLQRGREGWKCSRITTPQPFLGQDSPSVYTSNVLGCYPITRMGTSCVQKQCPFESQVLGISGGRPLALCHEAEAEAKPEVSGWKQGASNPAT